MNSMSYNEMKYSLTNKQFKKRNNIFGERRHEPVTFQALDQRLDEIKELGEELEDSKIQQEAMKDAGNKNVRKMGEVYRNSEEVFPQKKSRQHLKVQTEHRIGKHGLSPNTKPSVPLIRTAAKSIIGIKSLSITRKPLSICSKTIEFQFYSQETQVELTQTRQLLLKLYMILSKNNEKIVDLENLLLLLAERSNKLISEVQYSLAYALQLERKVDLFLNTMRNVYENLRISKLKQENLELFLKQSHTIQSDDRIQPSNKKRNHILDTNKREKPVKEVEELMSLLDYESDNSVVEPYHQRQEIIKQTPKNFQAFRSVTYEQDSVRIPNPNPSHQTSAFHHYPSHKKQTFRIEQGNFQRLSPFQANRLMSNLSQPSHFHNSFKKQQTEPIAFAYDKQPSLGSNHSYSFEASQCEKIRSWMKKRGEEGMICWLDDMGCLRRPNMTYVFWPGGEVMRLSPSSFLQLQSEGKVRRHHLQ